MYNYRGDYLGTAYVRIPYRPEYIDADGNPKWDEYIQNGDSDGFDITRKDENGEYVHFVVLSPGKRLVRYGGQMGKFSTDVNTPYELLVLPYRPETLEYHEYVVEMATKVQCIVKKGWVAPGFGSTGGAVQYKHEISMRESVRIKVLREDLSWMKKVR